ncbi:MAG: YhfC family glutamic-type intramembrane protease [Chloroflexota bacterium]
MTSLSNVAISAMIFQTAAYYLFPLLLWFILRRRLGVSWRFIGLGTLTWLTALPFIIGVPMIVGMLLGNSDPTLRLIAGGVALSLTAGIVEETSRYIYYRQSATLRDSSNLRHAIVAGAGHGGTESLVLGIQFVVLPAVMMLWFPQFIPAELRDLPFSATDALLNGASRMAIIICHIGFTLLIWQAVSQQRGALYILAVVLHILLNLLAFVLPVMVPGSSWVGGLFILVLMGWTLMQMLPALRRLSTAKLGMG